VVYDIHADAENKIWLATQDAGVVAMQGNTLTYNWIPPTGYLPTKPSPLAQDKQGTLWIGLVQWHCIAIASRQDTRLQPVIQLLHNKTFFCSHTDHAGVVWMGSTSGDVIMIFPDGEIRQLVLPDTYKNDFIGGIAEDSLHYIWLATDHGLLKYGRETFTAFTEQQGLPSNAVQTVMADYENNIWAGTLNGGAIQFVSEAFTRYTEKEGLSSQNVTAVCQDQRTIPFS
jgi:two-component system sensor histidine kinase ChiS